jgi:SAM-dependent methyltransferase
MTTFWTDPATALAWAEGDSQRDLLALPRAIAAEVIAGEGSEVLRIVDIASGPGAFLATFLEAFPEALGLWTDISEPLENLARTSLEPYGDRVDYRICDMTALGDLPFTVVVIITSRASHQLIRTELLAFYRDAAGHLAPGGWLVNLDHVGAQDGWDSRLRQARSRLVPQHHPQVTHHHNYPLTSIDDHLSGLSGSGLIDIEMPWRAFITCLFMARRAI